MKHQEHIVCVDASTLRFPDENGFVDFDLLTADIMLGKRALLEHDERFRQIIPICVLKKGDRIWTYARTEKGGEGRLRGKVSVSVGGHWDMADLVHENSVIDVLASFNKAMERELQEEITINGELKETRLMLDAICANDTEVDRVHLAVIQIVELSDDAEVCVNEDQLVGIGFRSAHELLQVEENLETWAKMICKHLDKPQS